MVSCMKCRLSKLIFLRINYGRLSKISPWAYCFQPPAGGAILERIRIYKMF